MLIGDVGFLLDRCSYFEFSLALVSGFVIHNFNDNVSRIYHSPIFVCTTDTDQASAQPDPGLHFHASLHDPHFESGRLHLVRTLLVGPFLERLLLHSLSPPGMVACRLSSCDLLCATYAHASGTRIAVVTALCANSNSLQSGGQWL